MLEVDSFIRQASGGLSAPSRIGYDGRGTVAEAPRPVEIPPAFYHDDVLPPPPPDDPHWREWYHGNEREPVSRLILIGLPICLAILGVLHLLVILLVLHLSASAG